MTSSQVPTPLNSPQHALSLSMQDTKKEGVEESLKYPFRTLDVQSVTMAYDTEYASLSDYEAGM